MDRPTLAIETSIGSYLASRPSRDPVTLRNQQLTHAWWNTRRHEYALYTSQAVLDEAAEGDAEMARRRLELLAPLPLLQATAEVERLAEKLRSGVPLPPNARTDATHVAVGAFYGANYLLTWNCKHIANPRLKHRIQAICRTHGYKAPELCTPREMLGE